MKNAKSQAASKDRYYVIYRNGGTHWATWTRLLERYTINEANAKRDELMAMGYQALTQSAEQLERIGMPYGWKSDSVNWSEDECTTEYDGNGLVWRTVHIKQPECIA